MPENAAGAAPDAHGPAGTWAGDGGTGPGGGPRFHGEAATVVLLRDGPDGLEALLLERPQRGSFAGAWVFPGGHVDPEDLEAEDSGPDAASLGAVRAARRETLEETGLELDPAGLVAISRWIPPAQAPKRLLTRFFLAAAPNGPVRLSADEHVGHAWLAPAEALERHARGQMQLVAPTWVTLHDLQGAASVHDALAAARSAEPREFHSRRQTTADGRQLILWSGDAEYDGDAVPGADLPSGRRHRMDITDLPWVYERTD